MKAAKLTALKKIEIAEVPAPEIQNGEEVLIRMQSVGVCGSDIHYYLNGCIGRQVIEYPFAVGHEGAGIVEEIGSAVTRVKPGDRVAVEPAMPCGQCDQCRVGRPHTCRKLRFLGCPQQAEGCLSEFIVVPEHSCFPVDDKMTMDEAALSEPLAIGVYAVQQSIPMKKANIGILGSGPIGLSVLLAALYEGCTDVYMTDRIDERLDVAEACGAKWVRNPDKHDIVSELAKVAPEMLDVVFECCGEQKALDQSIELLKPGGKLMIVGIPTAGPRVSFLIDELRHREICIQNIRRQNGCLRKTLDLLAAGKVNASRMVTHTFSFEKTAEAFDLVAGYKDGVVKAMIRM